LHKPPFSSVVGVWKRRSTLPSQSLTSSPSSAKRSMKCFTRAADALFELRDALLCSPGLLSFPELSGAPVFRRQWPSVYEALQDGPLDRDPLLNHCVEILPANPRPLLVGDHTAWGRPQARTRHDRTFEHQPTPIKGQQPITIGHGYRTLGVVPEPDGSWFVPRLARAGQKRYHPQCARRRSAQARLPAALRASGSALRQRIRPWYLPHSYPGYRL
jgi:hypothetical protein